MKHSMIWKTTLREIRGSLGRFLAIFAIVALGVGLFAGLKITKTDFLQSMTNYFHKQSFYDYRILGSLGFSQEEVAFLRAQEGVLYAEGAVFQDMYYLEENGNQKVGRFHSITNEVNKIVLVEGRMPEKEGEVLADAMYYSKNSLGKKITLSEENEETDLEKFQTDAYEIVGIVKSPLYIQFERGNSALGAGKADAFFYLPGDAFTVDYVTEIYVKFQQDYPLYSDDYESFLAGRETQWKTLVKEAGHMRYLEMPAMIEKGEKELREKSAQAQEKLEEAREELENASKEIADNEQKLSDGRKELDDGRKELEKAKQDVADGKKTIEEEKEELEKGKKAVEDGEREVAEIEKLIADKESEIAAGKKQLETAKMTLELGEMQQKLTMEELIREQKEIDKDREALETKKKRLEILEAYAERIGMEEAIQKHADERAAVKKEEDALEERLKKLNERYLDALAMEEQVKAGRREYEEGLRRLTDGEAALEKGKEAWRKGKKELLDAKKRILQGEEELRKAEKRMQEAERQIEEGERTIPEKEAEWKTGEEKLLEAKAELEKGWQEYREKKAEFEEKTEKAQNALQERKEQYEDGREPEGYLLGRNTNIGYVCFENDSAIVDGIANVFPVFFFLVAALVCVTTMNRMVEEQRTQIGVLKALGYSDGRIMFKFLFYSGLAAVSGCVLGYAGGTILFPFIIWTVYGIMYKAGAIAFTFHPFLAGISMLVSLLCSVGATYLSCGKELSGQAASLMRPRAPKAGKRVLLEKIPFLWRRLSFLRKVAIRNILRYKKRLFMMILGIGGCTGLLVTGFGIKDSVAGVAQVQYSEIQTYDIGVTLRNEWDASLHGEVEKLREKGLTDYLPCQENNLDLIKDGAQKSVTVLAFDDGVDDQRFSAYFNMRGTKGEKIPLPGKKMAVVTDKVADQLHVHVGDRIMLRGESMEEREFCVSGIMQNYIQNYVIITQEQIHPKTLYLKVEEDGNIRKMAAALMKMESVANLSVTEDVVARFDKMMASLDLIVVLVTFCAAGLAFIVLYNLTNINITERIREIATIKVLGFFSGETALYVFRENLVLTFLGSMAGLGMGKALHAFVIREVDVDLVKFAVRILPQSYLYSIGLTFLFSIFVNVMMNGKLERISMTESLKSVD